jgi:hypothetical protein
MSTDHVQRGTTAAGGLLGVSGMSFHPKVYAKKQTGNINNAAVESLTKKAATTGYRNRAEQVSCKGRPTRILVTADIAAV